jgi:hypothetical protein
LIQERDNLVATPNVLDPTRPPKRDLKLLVFKSTFMHAHRIANAQGQSMAESIPAKSGQLWKELLTGIRDPQFSALATKLTVARLRQTVRDRPDAMPAAIDELFRYFATNTFAQRDLQKL